MKFYFQCLSCGFYCYIEQQKGLPTIRPVDDLCPCGKNLLFSRQIPEHKRLIEQLEELEIEFLLSDQD